MRPYEHFTPAYAKAAQEQGSGLAQPHVTSSGSTSSSTSYPQSVQPASATRPGYSTSRGSTSRAGFQPPRYYERQGVDPRLASIGPGLEQEYGRAFPYGDYTYGQDPEQSLNRLSSSDRELRNRFMLYERMAQGQTPVNMNVITPAQQYGPWNYVKDTVSNLFSGTPAAHMTGALLDYQGVPVSGPEDIRVGTDYHTDVLRRIGNRWGGDFQLSYPNDRALDWASYSAEAAPIFLSAGASAAPQTVGTGGGFLEIGRAHV